MTKFTAYDKDTGVILSTGELSDETLEWQITQGLHAVLDANLSSKTHYIDVSNAQHTPREYTDDEKAALAGLAPGWVWQMPERVAVDQRTLDATRAAKVAEMSAACAAAILDGFPSSALGAEHTYPAKPTDQTNLAGSILDSLIAGPGDWVTPFWCAGADGAWDFRMHTAAQIQQVGRDGKAAILAAMTRNEALRAQIMESSIAQIDEIHW